MAERDDWGAHLSTVGVFIREQRRLVKLSQRQLAKATGLSDTYLSQLERGMHEPSVRALRAIAKGLNVSADQLISLTGALEDDFEEAPADAASADVASSSEAAIRQDPRLTAPQKTALLTVLASYLEANAASDAASNAAASAAPGRARPVSGGRGAPAGRPRPRRGSR